MGTSCISGVSAWHDFEQVVFIGWLSNKILLVFIKMKYIRGFSTVLSESVQMKQIEGLSTVLSESVQMKYIGGLSIVPSDFVQMKYIGWLSTLLSESVQLKYIKGMSTVLSEYVQMRKKKYRRWSNILSESVQRTFARIKTKTFCLKKKFIHGKNACVKESVRTRGMGLGMWLGMWPSCRKLHNFYLNGYEFYEHGIACALRWGVALVGYFLYWALLTPLWENHFSGTEGTSGDKAHLKPRL